MLSAQLTINNKSGLHARPATLLVQVAAKFQSTVIIKYQNATGNAKSLLSILSLGVTAGSSIELVSEGPDEVLALEELSKLINSLANIE